MRIQSRRRILGLVAASALALTPFGCGWGAPRTAQVPDSSRGPQDGSNAPRSTEPASPPGASRPSLAPAELFALLEEDILRLEGATAPGAGFELKQKMLRTDALALAVYAQVGIDEGDKNLTKKLALARNGALGFASAAKIGDREGAARAITVAKEFRAGLLESQPRSIHVPLDSIIPLTNLMEQSGLLGAALGEWETTPPAEWPGPKQRAALQNTWRVAALIRAMEPYVPETDPNPRKGQTRKLWQESLRDCRTEIDALLIAARASAPTEYAARYKALDAACNRCHAAYRVE